MTTSNRRSLLFGGLCAAVGLLVGLLVTWRAEGDGLRWLSAAAAVAAFVCGAALWRLLPENRAGNPRLQGALAGGLAGLVAHYFTWYFQYVGANLCYWTTGGCTGSLGDPPANLLEALAGAAGFSFFSLLGFGWLTLLAGAALGLVFASSQLRGSA